MIRVKVVQNHTNSKCKRSESVQVTKQKRCATLWN